jgi:conjugative transfer signal peptidase TraF
MRRSTAVLLGAAALTALAGVTMTGWLGGYRINLTPSFPLGLWRIEQLGRDPAAGDLVFICVPVTPAFMAAFERGYIRRGLCPGWLSPLIKTIAAVHGQHVDIGSSVSIDGMPLRYSEIQTADGEGRALSAWQGGTVPLGQLYLHSDFSGSYDSRYFGPVSSNGLLGVARPVLTIDP